MFHKSKPLRVKFIVALILSGICSDIGQAQGGYIYLGSDTQNTRWSIITNDNTNKDKDIYRRVWIYMDHSRNKNIPARESKTLFRIYCESNTIGVLYNIDYSKYGMILKSEEVPEYRVNQGNIVPGTMGETLANYMCRGILPE